MGWLAMLEKGPSGDWDTATPTLHIVVAAAFVVEHVRVGGVERGIVVVRGIGARPSRTLRPLQAQCSGRSQGQREADPSQAHPAGPQEVCPRKFSLHLVTSFAVIFTA